MNRLLPQEAAASYGIDQACLGRLGLRFLHSKRKRGGRSGIISPHQREMGGLNAANSLHHE